MTTLEFRADDALAVRSQSRLASRIADRAIDAEPDTALWMAAELDRALGTLNQIYNRPLTARAGDALASARLSLATVQALANTHRWQADAVDLDLDGPHRAPTILPVGNRTAFLVLLEKRRRSFTVLAPNGRRLKRTHVELETHTAAERSSGPQDAVALPVPEYLRERLRRANRSSPPCYRLIPTPPSRLFSELVASGLPRLGLLLFGLLVLAQGLEIGGWGLFGGAVLNGGHDIWGMLGWMLLLATLHLLSMPIQRAQSELTLRAGLVIKRRLQRGALAMDLDNLRRLGPSALTSRTIEAQALEQSGLAAVLMGLTAVVELITTAFICTGGAAGILHLLWMIVLFGAIAVAAIPYAKSLSEWTAERRRQASRLVESIAGHRTTRLQVHPLRRRDRLDNELTSYVQLSRRTDRWARWMLLGLPSLWTVGSVVTLVPSALWSGLPATGVAITIGAALLGARGLNTTVGSIAAAFRARLAWLQLADLLAAATSSPEAEAPTTGQGDAHRLVDVSFHHPGRSVAALDRVSVELGTTEKILLTGASGSGKSTFGTVLTGLRQPGSGRLQLGGRNGTSMAAPQAQENHIFSATLAENLFPAGIGPLEPADEARALDVLHRIQLDSLLGRMPLGLFQRLGSGGWALSQGEKSRICVARALLADADLVVLDESFGPLDPDTARACLEAAHQLSRTLVVIAHP
jgi:ATP-binding cassette, subfamily B, bacterial